MGVIFQDSFTEAGGVDVLLANHTPDTGTGWSVGEESASAQIEVAFDLDLVRPDRTSNSARCIDVADDGPTGDYDVSLTVVTVPASGADEPVFLVGRWADADNYYSAGSYIGAAAADKKIYKKVAGTVTELASGDGGLSDADVLRFELRTNSQELFVNDSSVLSASDTALTAAGQAGLGFGNAWNATDDVSSAWEVDDFEIEEIAGGGGGKVRPPTKLGGKAGGGKHGGKQL